MKGSLPRIFIISFCILSGAALALVSGERWILKDAGRLYGEGKYNDALQQYHNVLVRYLHRDISALNSGAALYKKGDYQKAMEVFGEPLASPAPSAPALANYNRGNCRYRQGQQSESENPESSRMLYGEARAYYRRAIALNPGDADSRYNLAVVEKRLIHLSERTGEKDSRGEKTSGKTREEAFKENVGKAQNQESFRQPTDSTALKDSTMPVHKETRVDAGKKSGMMKITKGTLSREEAEMLLEEFRQREEKGGLPSGKTAMGYHREVEKDW